MTTQISTQTISFNNQALITFEQNGKYYTAMKPICENIGLDWASQYSRIKRDEILSQGVVIITTPSNGGDQQMIYLPIEYLNGWLFGIDVKRCKPEIRETLIKYKKECYQALHDYWFNGKAEKQTFAPIDQSAIEADEEALYIIVNLFHSLNGAYEMGNKIRKEHPYLAKEIDKTIGGHYIYNLNGPTENALTKARKYIHAKSERIMFVKGMLSLLEEPKRRLGDF